MLLRSVLSVLSGATLAACSVVGIRQGTEEPPYSVVQIIEPDLEIRQYEPRLAAETIVQGDEVEARSEGFRRIAGFIFGGNQTEAKIAMTAPVATSQFVSGQQIAMTAPADQARIAEGWRVRFFMPSGYTLDTLPRPNDARVVIVTVPAETYAVYRYSGSISTDNTARAQNELTRKLQGTGWVPTGGVVSWFYDPPWTLPPFRRNEAAVIVEKR